MCAQILNMRWESQGDEKAKNQEQVMVIDAWRENRKK